MYKPIQNKIMKRLAIKSISLVLLLAFLTNTACYGLAPELRTATPAFKEFYTAASICRTIEQEGNLDSNSYINDILPRIEALKKNYDNVSVTILPHEVVIEIPAEGMAVRYFNPHNANVVTAFSDITKLRTKIIGKKLCRQIIYRTKLLPAPEYKYEHPLQLNDKGAVASSLADGIASATRKGISLFTEKKKMAIQKEQEGLKAEQNKPKDKQDAKKIDAARKAIEKAQKAIGEVERLVKTQNELAMVPLNQAIQRLKENHHQDVAEILIDLYPIVLPYLVNGQDESPVHHIAHVVNFMSEILVGEVGKKISPEDVKRGIIATLLHDIGIGGSVLPKITENMVKNEVDLAKREALRAAAIDSRKEHMEKGAEIARGILEEYNKITGQKAFSGGDIETILHIVGKHDNSKIPLMMVLQKYDNSDIPEAVSKDIKEYLLTSGDSDWLMQLHWEADALWMLSSDGLLVDLKRQGEADTPKNRLEKITYNMGLHREVVNKVYKKIFNDSDLKKFGFRKDLLYRSSTGYKIASRLSAPYLLDLMETQVAVGASIDYGNNEDMLYAAVKDMVGKPQKLTDLHIRQLNEKIRKIVARLENIIVARERATDYSLWNIKQEHGGLYSFKQFVLTYKILDRVLKIIETSHYSQSQKDELRTMISYFFYAALPEFIDGRKGNPIHHNVQVLENMLLIVLAEKPAGFEFLKQSVVLALLHDVGNSRTSGVKVKSSTLKELKKDVKKAKDDAEKKAGEDKLQKTFIDAENYRRSHMMAGAEMVRALILDYHNYVGNAIFKAEAINAICDVVKGHDNPSMASYQKEILGKIMDLTLLFDPANELALYLREADRVWMVSPEGVEKDLMDEVEKAGSPAEKLAYNTDAHRSEYILYKENVSETRLAAYGFKDGTLYCTKRGYSLYRDLIKRVGMLLELSDRRVFSEDELMTALFKAKRRIAETRQNLQSNKSGDQPYDLQSRLKSDCELAGKTYDKIVANLRLKLKGKPIIIAMLGPSGVGKATVIQYLIKTYPEVFTQLVRVADRSDIKKSRDKILVTKKQFKTMRDNREFLLTTEHYGNHYGITKKEWSRAIGSGKIILFDGVDSTSQILNMPELSKEVDVKVIGLYPADPNRRDLTQASIEQRERERVVNKPGIMAEDEIQQRKAEGVEMVEAVRKMADETVVNIPALLSKKDLFKSIEQKVISCLGLHNFAPVARKLNAKPSFEVEIPNKAKLVLRLREPGRSEISITHTMFNNVTKYLYEAGYIDDRFVMVPLDTEEFGEEHYHRLLTAMQKGIQLDNDINVIGLNLGAPFKASEINKYIANREIMKDGVSFVVCRQTGKLMGDLDDGKAFMGWFQKKYGRPDGYDIVLIGAGPANVAIALEMAKANISKICITDQDYQKAQRLAVRLNEIGINAIAVKVGTKVLHEEVGRADVIINGTGIGKRPKNLKSPLTHDPANNQLSYKDKAVLVDLDYNLGPDNFLAQGRSLNPTAQISNGIGFMIEYNSRQIAKIIGCSEGDPLYGIVHKLVEKIIFKSLPLAKDIDWSEEHTYVADSLPDQYLQALACFNIPDVPRSLNVMELRAIIMQVSNQGGTRKTVYKVTLKSGAEYILKKEPTKNQAVINLSKFYRQHNIPYPAFLQTHEGSAFAEVDGNIFSLQEALYGRQPNRGNLSNIEIVRIAEQLAAIHRLGAKYKPSRGERAFKLGADQDFLQIDQFGKIGEEVSALLSEIEAELKMTGSEKKHPWRNEEKLKDFRELFHNQATVEAAIRHINEYLPEDVFRKFPHTFYVHGDFFQGNILMQDSSISAVFDLERSRKAVTRWEDLLTPMWELNYHIHQDGRSFDFDRFALWMTSYNHSLLEKEKKLALAESERLPEHLRSLLLLGYLQELHKGLKNRETWVKPGYVMAQVRNIQDILKIGSDRFEALSRYLEKGMIWDEAVSESRSWLNQETSYMSALGLQVNSRVLRHCDQVACWLANRVATRCAVKIDEDLLAMLARELSENGLSKFANKGKAPANTQVEKIKKLIYQEAQLLRSAVPLMRHKAEFREVEIGLEPGALEGMRQGRAQFYNRYEELYKNMRYYWEDELPKYRGNITSFNPDSKAEDKAVTPEVSIVIVSVSSRLKQSLFKRLEEMNMLSSGVKFEVNVVLADPENIAPDIRQELDHLCQKLAFPIKLIESKKNTIATNRNLGSLESRGKYIVFLDDDVRLVGDVIKSLIDTLKKYPEIGISQMVSYDIDTGLHKPKSEYLKYAIDSQTVISNDVAGMIMATRADIVKILPFIPFWPNFGEDGWFGKQTQGIGFMLAFVYSDDAYVIHEHVQSRVTNDANTLKNVLLHDTLSYYLEPEYYKDEMRDGKVIMRFQRFGDPANTFSFEEIKAFWLYLRTQVTRFLDGEDSALNESSIEKMKSKFGWAHKNSAAIDHVAAFYKLNEKMMRTFKRDYNTKKLAKNVNLFLGALQYKEKEAGQKKEIAIGGSEKEAEEANIALDEKWGGILRQVQDNEELHKNLLMFLGSLNDSSVDIAVLKTQFIACITGLSNLYNQNKDKGVAIITKTLLREVARRYPIFTSGWLAETSNGTNDDAKRFLTSVSRDIIRESKQGVKVVNLIVAGGKGESFYPLITQEEPKQFLKLNQFRGESLLEHAIDLAQSRGDNETFILASPEIEQSVKKIAARKGISENRILVASERFPGTAAAIVHGLAHICKEFGQDTVVSIFNTDLDFENRNRFDQSLSLAEAVANVEPSILHIVARTFPHPSCAMVMPAKEKSFVPNLSGCASHLGKSGSIEEARQRIAEGALWYSGIRIGKISTLLAAIEQSEPQYAKAFDLIRNTQSVEWQQAASELSMAIFEQEIKRGFSETAIWQLLGTQTRIGIGLVRAPFGSHIGSLHYRIEHDRGVDGGDNAVRLFGNSKSEQVSYERCRHCDFIINDETLKIHAYGLEGITIAYDGTKKALVVVPAEEVGKSVKRIIRTLQSSRRLQQYYDISKKVTPSRRDGEYLTYPGNNAAYFENKGDAIFENSENCTTHCKDGGLIAASGVSGLTVIHDGNDIYIYGVSASNQAKEHLSRMQEGKRFVQKSMAKVSAIKTPAKYTTVTSGAPALSDHAKTLRDIMSNFQEFARFNYGLIDRKKNSRENIEADIFREAANKTGPLASTVQGFDHFLRMGRGEHRFSYAVYRIGNIAFAVRVKEPDFNDNLPVLYEEQIDNHVCQIIELDTLMKYWAETFPPDNADFVNNFTEQPYIRAMALQQAIVTHGKNLVIEDRAGQGHEGVVYKARELETGKIYAIKVGRASLKSTYGFWKKSFEKIRTIPNAEHALIPYLVEFYSYEEATNSILMDYVNYPKSFEGMYIKDGRNVFETMRALSIIETMSRVLGTLYKENIHIADAHSNNIMCHENSDACKFIDPTTSSDRTANLEYKNIFKMGVSLYRLFSAISLDEQKISDFRKALERNIVDVKKAQEIFDLKGLDRIDEQLKGIILKSLFTTDDYYKSMISLADDLKDFLQLRDASIRASSSGAILEGTVPEVDRSRGPPEKVPSSHNNVMNYLDINSPVLRSILGEEKQDVLLRIPFEAVEAIGIENINNFLATFQGAPNGYVELYYMSGIGGASDSIYQKYGLQKKPLPKDFRRTRENTITLFPALKGEEINQSTIVSRLGSIDMTPDNTILSPIGLQRDPAGLIRASILGLKMMDIARQVKEKGIDITKDQAFKDKIQLEILEQLKNVCYADDLKNFNLTSDDIIALATGTINNIIIALKKLIKLLPITPINAEELRQIYEHAKAVITAA